MLTLVSSGGVTDTSHVWVMALRHVHSWCVYRPQWSVLSLSYQYGGRGTRLSWASASEQPTGGVLGVILLTKLYQPTPTVHQQLCTSFTSNLQHLPRPPKPLCCTMLPDKAVALHAPYLSPAGGTGELLVSLVNKGVNNFVFLNPDLICVSGLLL